MINVLWDNPTLERMGRMLDYRTSWETNMYSDLSKNLANWSVNFIKPYLAAKRTGYPSTGTLQREFRSIIEHTSDGFGITFEAPFYGIYMDVGNEPESNLTPKNGPYMYVDSRFGPKYIRKAKQVSPMGTNTDGVPTHYSELAFEQLKNGVLLEMALDSMTTFIAEMIL